MGQTYGEFPAQKVGSIWQCIVHFPTSGSHGHVFKSIPDGVRFSLT
jgi:hypothetical protein